MGKMNPKQNNLREISSVERPKQLGINKSIESDPYGIDKIKPEKGDTIDQSTRTKNLAMNVFDEKNYYHTPDDAFL